MPGLNQLKEFSRDVEKLGDELRIRSERGEFLSTVPLPEGVPDDDDSADFVSGLPEPAVGPSLSAGADAADSDGDAGLGMSDDRADSLPSDPVIDAVPDSAEAAPEQDIASSAGDDAAQDYPVFENGSDMDMPDFSDLFDNMDMPDDLSFDGDNFDIPSDPPPDGPAAAGQPLSNPEGSQDTWEDSAGSAVSADFSVPDDFPNVDPSSQDESPEYPEQKPEEGSAVPSSFELPIDEYDTDFTVPDQAGLNNNIQDKADFPAGDGIIDFDSDDIYDIPEEFAHDENQTGIKPSAFQDAPEIDDISYADTDEGSDIDFDIPGFSDVDVDTEGSAPLKHEQANRQKFELTDTEYEQFRKNLQIYPLNLRIAIEDMIVKNEFKDSVIYEVIQKVVKRASTRHLAGHLEKILDTSITIPRDFERRTAAQYEAYKSSFEYKLKNRIIPGALFGICGLIVCFLLFLFTKYVVYYPLRAELLYRQGYTLLGQGLFQQAELQFNEAVSFKAKKNWYFTYARGYREHRQYDRARSMYESLLQYFDHDLKAGLEYAGMELNDLANYERAAEILKRQVLDYHINNKDAMLLLGDVYLEWATEKDPLKFEDARRTYSSLMDLYGASDLYLARMLRYYIRTDDLKNVLQLKEYFFPHKKILGSPDLVELGSYLLDKLYGPLPVADEYLRSFIEDVRGILERAVEISPEMPDAVFHLSRYFMVTENRALAKAGFENALNLFSRQSGMKDGQMLGYINTYRYLGELYAAEGEYVRAQEYFSAGIDLFENAKQQSGMAGTKDVGILYSDMADIDYFNSGDMSAALRNYRNAVLYDNDTPSIRYRIGYIQYGQKDYDGALEAFINAVEEEPTDAHALLALGNVLALRDDNFAAEGYYRRLINKLDGERVRYGIMMPQIHIDHADIVENYMYGANNMGVVLYRLAKQTGQSPYFAEAQIYFSESIRAWDALTRNQDTMVRLDGRNLAAQNSQYMSHPLPAYEPEIYTAIPRVLSDEASGR